MRRQARHPHLPERTTVKAGRGNTNIPTKLLIPVGKGPPSGARPAA